MTVDAFRFLLIGENAWGFPLEALIGRLLSAVIHERAMITPFCWRAFNTRQSCESCALLL